MKYILPFLLTLGVFPAAEADADEKDPWPDMGAAWFGRVTEKETRIGALYDREISSTTKGRKPEPFEEFSADISYSAVFPFPQPGLPEAHTIFTGRNWERRDALLRGPDSEDYPPLPVETERWSQWQAMDARKAPGFRMWQTGRPLLESFSLNLVDPQGKQLSEGFFCGVGALADFNRDGMQDLFEIERVSARKAGEPETTFDCISIGPLIAEQARFAQLYCNPRSRDNNSRQWFFTIRDQAEQPVLVLIPAKPDVGKELILRLQDGNLMPQDAEALPGGIWIDQNPAGESWDSSSAYLKNKGFSGSGFGSDSAAELEAGRPKPKDMMEAFPNGGLELTLPNTAKFLPRDAALAIVATAYDPYYTPYYEWRSEGAPVPLPEEGWLEMTTDHGWSSDEVSVWWLTKDGAECWTPVYPKNPPRDEKAPVEFIVTRLPRNRVAHDLAVIHELERIRRVPKEPQAPDDEHSRWGGSDHTSYRLRAKTTLPSGTVSRFFDATPTFWGKFGSRYDRQVSALLATALAQKLPEGEAPERRKLRELAPHWLTRGQIYKVPPALSRAAIQAIGENPWPELKPLLQGAKELLGTALAEELRLEDLRIAAGNPTDNDALQRQMRMRALEAERLLDSLTGEPSHELRTTLENALKPNSPRRGP